MSEQLLDSVKSKYGAVAESILSNDHAGVQALAEAFGYTAEELTSIPAGANMGLSCGNPTATAHLRPGEVVVDLGSGGGLDVFLAAKMVGPTGRAIGIDMTIAMIERARANSQSGGYTNVEFYQSTIDLIPLPDASVDCVISNCVLNLAPDKPAVFREIARVLKPGGRVAVSDIALKHELPETVAQSMAAYVGCIAGAIKIDDYKSGLVAAGFEHVEIVDSGADLNAYAKVENQAGCCSPAMDTSNPFQVIEAACCTPASAESSLHEDLTALLSQYDVNAAAASVKVYAIKPHTADSKAAVARTVACSSPTRKEKKFQGASMPHYNVLFLCTGNYARSIMAEAIMNRKGHGNLTAYSAGSYPTGAVRPEAIRQLEKAGLDASAARSKSWEEFSAPDSPHLSFVLTVCDNAANEVCPIWPGQPITAHWGIPDPAAVQGTADEIDRAFSQSFQALDRRISLFLNLPLETLDSFAIQKEIEKIGKQ